MNLKLYNTMTRAAQDFIPVNKDCVGFYGCGPTVYNYAHIGNLRAYVFQDVLVKTLKLAGYNVKHVMNITDIGHLTSDMDEGEDKMLETARKERQSVLEIADFYAKAFFEDTDRLNIARPDVVCRATEHIPDMIALIRRIEANGHTYTAGGNLYFDVSTFADYGKLARLDMDRLKPGARIDIDKNKRNPRDFVLWFTKSKFENHALSWDSPWGRGYPGWHIECSAMSMKYLGEEFDIHAGGIDHIPVHHTNEIAQSESAIGHTWVRYWVHNEFLVLDKEKMSKSSGNFLTLQTLVDEGFSPLDYRYFLLGGHYRSQLMFSWPAMESARGSRKSLLKQIKRLRESAGDYDCEARDQSEPISEGANRYILAFKDSLANDIATPKALADLWNMLKDDSISARDKLCAACAMDGALSIGIRECARSESANGADELSESERQEIEALVAERSAAKKNKDYKRADELRAILNERGIAVKDLPDGAVWEKI